MRNTCTSIDIFKLKLLFFYLRNKSKTR